MQIKSSPWIWAVGTIAAILLTATFLHYPITLVNALTLEQVPGFAIHISAWRILFEPFIGLLLYFNQSFYAIKEFALLLVWILLMMLIYTGIKSFRQKEKQTRRQFLFHQLFNLILVVGIWFSAFVAMIFLQLPNNVIVNNNPDLVLVTTHSHTEYSHDGLISRQGLWNWHKRNHFDAFFITDHNNHRKTLEFVQDQAEGRLPEFPAVLPGEEFSGSNHLSLLGLKKDFRSKGFTDSTAIAYTRQDSGAVLVNHWFDGEHKSLEYYRDLGVDGFEIENTATDKRYDRDVYGRIKHFCEQNHLIMVGGLDFHGYGSACTIWNAFEVPGWRNLERSEKEKSILKILRTRDQSKLSVILYNDRPYYPQQKLFFSTPKTLFNYFRTLNLLQVASWICWIVVVMLLSLYLKSKSPWADRITCHRLLPLAGVVGSLFLLALGMNYFRSVQTVEDFTKMFGEYGNLLMKAGAALLVVSGFVGWWRIFRKSSSD